MRTMALLLVAWLLTAAVGLAADDSASPSLRSRFGLSPGGTGSTRSASSTKAPNVFTKMTSGTKRFFTNTKSLVTPKKPPKKTRGVTAIHRAEKTEQPKQGFFSQLFHPQSTEPPRTVKEWMSLDQVHP